MIKEFTYPLPDELYVEGISGNNVQTFTYNGPEELYIQLNSEGNVRRINLDSDFNLEESYKKVVDPNIHPETAHFLLEMLGEVEWEYQYEEEIMENGDVYQNILNPKLSDAYSLRYDYENDDWVLSQIVKLEDSPSTIIAKKRKELIEGYLQNYTFTEEITKEINDYLLILNNYIENNPPIKFWKYINLIPPDILPEIPVALENEFSNLPPAAGDI